MPTTSKVTIDKGDESTTGAFSVMRVLTLGSADKMAVKAAGIIGDAVAGFGGGILPDNLQGDRIEFQRPGEIA